MKEFIGGGRTYRAFQSLPPPLLFDLHLSPDVFLPSFVPNPTVRVRCPFGSGTGIRAMLERLQLG